MQNAYDELGRATGSTYVIGDTTQTYGITYEDINGLVQNYTTLQNSYTYTYDATGRLIRERRVSNLDQSENNLRSI